MDNFNKLRPHNSKLVVTFKKPGIVYTHEIDEEMQALGINNRDQYIQEMAVGDQNLNPNSTLHSIRIIDIYQREKDKPPPRVPR